MAKKTVIRPSATTSWLDCARRAATTLFRADIRGAGFELRGLNRNVGAAVGSSVHKAAHYTLEQKITTGEIGTDKDAIDLGCETFRTEIAEGVMWDDATRSLNEADRQIERMAKVYRYKIVPGIDPVSVEERLEAEYKGVIISGQKDVLARSPAWLRDLKTGKGRASHIAQLGTYSLIERTNGNAVHGLKEDFIPRASIKKPQPEPETLTYDIAAAEHIAIEVLDDIIESHAEFKRRLQGTDKPPEHAFLPNPSSILCSEKYCPAHGTRFCRAHRPTE